MTRKIFFILLALIIVAAFFLHTIKYFFIVEILSMWTLLVLRLTYLGLNWKQALKVFFISGPLNDYWWKMWQKDPAPINNKS